MNFDYCLQTKEKKNQIKQQSTMMNNYFLVLDYLEFWHNLMIVSMFLIVDKWGTFEIVNPKHYDWASVQGSTLSVLCSLSTVSKYFKIWLKTYFSSYVQTLNPCVFAWSQDTIWSTPNLLWAADFFWPCTDKHSPVVSFFTWLYTVIQFTETFSLRYCQQVNK